MWCRLISRHGGVRNGAAVLCSRTASKSTAQLDGGARALAARLPPTLQASAKHLQSVASDHTNSEFSTAATSILSTAEPEVKQATLPVVDLACWDDEGSRAEIGAQIKKACEESGFFYLANHGVSAPSMEAALAATKEFFALPLEVKREIQWKAFVGEVYPPSARGYCGLRGEGLDPSALADDKEFVDLGLDVQLGPGVQPKDRPFCGPNKWPRCVVGEKPMIKDSLEQYIEECRRAAEKLLRAVALSLDLDFNFFEQLTDDPVVMHRIIHYPAVEKFEESGLRISAGKHTDYGLITLLYQVEYGLQMRERNGQWVWVPPPPAAHMFTVNIGDCMQILTNGRYQSTMHRVVNCSGRDRYSMAFFFDPNVDAVLHPILQTPAERARGDAPMEPQFEPVAAGEVKLAKYQAVWEAEHEVVSIEHGLEQAVVRDVLFRN